MSSFAHLPADSLPARALAATTSYTQRVQCGKRVRTTRRAAAPMRTAKHHRREHKSSTSEWVERTRAASGGQLVFFFDNDATNFHGCDGNIIQIKVDETPDAPETKTRGAAMRRMATGAAKLIDDRQAAEVMCKTCRYLYERMDDFSIVYDPRAGITPTHLTFAIDHVMKGDLVFLDFDRALSVIEGFIFITGKWEAYLLGARAHFGVSDDITVDDLIRAQLGGSKRVELLAHGLSELLDAVGAANAYVLTNNPNVALIHGVMTWLAARLPSVGAEASAASAGFGSGFGSAPPPLTGDHILSTHIIARDERMPIPVTSKADVIRHVVDGTADGTVEESLRRWHGTWGGESAPASPASSA